MRRRFCESEKKNEEKYPLKLKSPKQFISGNLNKYKRGTFTHKYPSTKNVHIFYQVKYFSKRKKES